MRKLFKKPILLCGTVVAVLGLIFTDSGNKTVKAQSDIKWCDWIDTIPGYPYDGCNVDMLWTPCICENQC